MTLLPSVLGEILSLTLSIHVMYFAIEFNEIGVLPTALYFFFTKSFVIYDSLHI